MDWGIEDLVAYNNVLLGLRSAPRHIPSMLFFLSSHPLMAWSIPRWKPSGFSSILLDCPSLLGLLFLNRSWGWCTLLSFSSLLLVGGILMGHLSIWLCGLWINPLWNTAWCLGDGLLYSLNVVPSGSAHCGAGFDGGGGVNSSNAMTIGELPRIGAGLQTGTLGHFILVPFRQASQHESVGLEPRALSDRNVGSLKLAFR